MLLEVLIWAYFDLHYPNTTLQIYLLLYIITNKYIHTNFHQYIINICQYHLQSLIWFINWVFKYIFNPQFAYFSSNQLKLLIPFSLTSIFSCTSPSKCYNLSPNSFDLIIELSWSLLRKIAILFTYVIQIVTFTCYKAHLINFALLRFLRRSFCLDLAIISTYFDKYISLIF